MPVVRIVFGRAAWTAARATMRCPGGGGEDGLGLGKRLDDAAVLSWHADAQGGVAEDLSVLLRMAEQRPQRDDLALSLLASGGAWSCGLSGIHALMSTGNAHTYLTLGRSVDERPRSTDR